MPNPPILLKNLGKSRSTPLWEYASNRVAGAFRAISVSSLLASSPSIALYEWQDGLDGKAGFVQPTENVMSRPKYAAISHVWKPSEAVDKLIRESENILRILKETKVGTNHFERNEHKITWEGLVDAARAARHRQCEYIWLDLLCIDQKRDSGDKEKKKQIKNMGNIYERADTVFIMVGGVAGVQGVDDVSAWIDRAWTLQEAVVCPNTMVLVNWPYPARFNAPPVFRDPDNINRTFTIEFTKIGIGHLSYIDLRTLLELQLTGGQIIANDPQIGQTKLPNNFAIKCFDSNVHEATSEVLKVTAGRMALLAVIDACAKKPINKQMKHCAVWRSMHLRISSNQEDIVWSILHLLDVKLEDTDGLSLSQLYVRLTQQVAREGIPAWLGIGGGNGDVIPRDDSSGLCPGLPIRQRISQLESETETYLPTYIFNARPLPASRFISRLPDYISKFDLEFKDWGTPNEYVCCRMFEFRSQLLPMIRPLSGEAGDYQSSMLELANSVKGVCMYKYWDPAGKRISESVNIVIIGEIQWSERLSLPVSEPRHHSWYVYFVQKNRGKWSRVGAGMFSILHGKVPPNRTHMIFGKISPGRDQTCNCSERVSERRNWNAIPTLRRSERAQNRQNAELVSRLRREKKEMESMFKTKYNELLAHTRQLESENVEYIKGLEEANADLLRRISQVEGPTPMRSLEDREYASRVRHLDAFVSSPLNKLIVSSLKTTWSIR